VPLKDVAPGGAHGDEVGRLAHRPTGPSSPLSTFYVEVGAWDEADAFAGRIRSLVTALVEISGEADFSSAELPEVDLPGWVSGRWDDAAVRYALHRGDEQWSIQDLLFSFDPAQRAWSWWDVTRVAGNVIQVWVDSGGEPVYNCEELRWILYLSGARTVVGPILANPSDWEFQATLGLDENCDVN